MVQKLEKKKVLIGMSGGVDSSVSALLLKQAGYEVIGATMRLWEDKEQKNTEQDSCLNQVVNEAQKVCAQIGIPHYVLDCREEFKEKVIQNFIQCYLCAKTPNPCVECNKYFKFDVFYQKAQELGCDYISTGHYAKVEYSKQYGQYVLKKSKADKKDQTYFLYNINKAVLPKLIFPLEHFQEKSEIRKIAEENKLEVANKTDSQEICFITNNDYVAFLQDNMETPQKQGNIILQDGTIVGKHQGLIYYTVGQRKGLGISYKEPLYVLKLNEERNEVIVGTEKELYSSILYANELNFLLNMDLSKPTNIKAKIRYRAKEADAILYLQEDGMAKVEFKEPQKAITPGQSVVFYIDDVVLGGGKIIDRNIKN